MLSIAQVMLGIIGTCIVGGVFAHTQSQDVRDSISGIILGLPWYALAGGIFLLAGVVQAGLNMQAWQSVICTICIITVCIFAKKKIVFFVEKHIFDKI